MSLLPFHVLGGAVAIVFGLIALTAGKGGWLHGKSGTVFVYAMLVMSLSGIYLWWPRSIGFRRGLRYRRGPATSYNLHHILADIRVGLQSLQAGIDMLHHQFEFTFFQPAWFLQDFGRNLDFA